MGKNQMFKAIQRAKHVAALDGSLLETEDGTVDASFHTPEWHAARMAALQHRRMSWEEYKKKVKEEEGLKSKMKDEEERVMMEYRAQLAADREKKMRKKSEVKSHKRKKSSKDRVHRHKDKTNKHHNDVARKIKKSRRKRSPSGEGRQPKNITGSDSDSSPIRLSEYLKS